MKQIIFLCYSILSFSVVDAQTTKKRSAKKQQSSTSRQVMAQARLDSLQALRQQKIDSALTYNLRYDSARRERERVAYEKFQQDQLAWKQTKMQELDSSNKEQWKNLGSQRANQFKVYEQRAELSKAAKLNEYQKAQVNYINQNMFKKARKINADSSIADSEKKEELVKLNEERKLKIQTIVGKSKIKKLEKARKSGSTEDSEAKWIKEVDGLVKS